MSDERRAQQLRDLDMAIAALDEVRRSLLPAGGSRACPACHQNPPQAPAAEALGKAAWYIEKAIAALRKEE